MEELQGHLARFRKRLRLCDGWLLAQRTLWWAALVALLWMAVGRVLPVASLKELAATSAALWLLGVLGYSLFRPMSPLRVACRVDGELGLKERLSTSLALQNGSDKLPEGVRASFKPELVDRLHADAITAARRIRPEQAFPMLWLRRPLLMAAGLALAVVLLAVLPNPMERVLAERDSVKRTAQQQAKKIDDLKKEVQESQELTPAEREELLRKLEELAKQLRENRGDREAALADLSKAEESLREKLQPNASARQAALEAMAAQLQALSKGEHKPGDLTAAAKDLQNLAEAMKSMNESERQALAQALAQMAASAGQAGDAGLAQALADLSMAAQSGDPQAASQAAQKAGQALQSAQRQMAGQAALQRALSQLQASRQMLSQAGQATASSQQPGQAAGNPGQAPGQSGQNPGNSPGSGGGSNANTLPPFQGSGQAKPPQGQKPGSTGSDLGQQVYAPRLAGGKKGEIFIPGQDTGQGTTQERQTKDPLPGVLNPALVPYQEVLQGYKDAANQALDQSYIPSGLKEYVKGYFESLGQ
jgi:hypothetical protein